MADKKPRTCSDLAGEISKALYKIHDTLTNEERENWEEAVEQAASEQVDGGLRRNDPPPDDSDV